MFFFCENINKYVVCTCSQPMHELSCFTKKTEFSRGLGKKSHNAVLK
jgi:hypothetical protein